ncbi:MAG: hypothetical protein KKD31_04780 [Bacteroidetes bacterium]|nr:hypothetical protein [Bacteroidota bacterium]
MKKIFTLLVVLYLMNNQAFSQNLVLFQSTTQESYNIVHQNSSAPNQQIINHFLTQIAQAAQKPVYRTEYSFTFDQAVKISRSGVNLYVSVDFNNFNCSGDILYKGFPMTEVLIPSKVQFKAQLKDQQGTVRFDWDVPPSAISTTDGRINLDAVDSTNIQKCSFEFTTKQFIYDQEAKVRFDERVADVNTYYATDMTLASMFADLQAMEPANPDFAQANDMKMKQITAGLLEIEGQRYFKSLNLVSYDPAMIMKKLSDVKYLADEKGKVLSYTVTHLHEIYYAKGLEYLVNNKRRQAIELFNKSLQANPAFVPALYQLAKIDYDDQLVDEAAQKIRNIYTQPYIDPENSQLIQNLAVSINNYYIRIGDEKNDDGLFQEALTFYSTAYSFCSAIPTITCSSIIQEGMNKARLGIFQAFISDAGKLIDAGNLDAAEEKISQAISYQKNYPAAISSDADAVALMNKSKSIRYNDLVAEGKKQLTAKNYRTAFLRFQTARQLEKSYDFVKNAELPKLLTKAKKPLIIESLESGKKAAAANNLTEARNILKQAMADRDEYNLSSDKEIAALVDELKEKIFSQECVNAQAEYDAQILKAKEQETKLQYINAESTYKNAIAVVEKNPDCGIARASADDGKLRILPAATYQKLINEINGHINVQNFRKAMDRYAEADQYFGQMGIAGFGLQHIPFMEFTRNQRPNFILFVASEKIAAKSYDEALDLMTLLAQRMFPAKQMRAEQTNLGTQLAIRDHSANPGGNPSALIAKYTGGNKALKYLKKAYTKQWKKLK